jgi:hypothetical protein
MRCRSGRQEKGAWESWSVIGGLGWILVNRCSGGSSNGWIVLVGLGV